MVFSTGSPRSRGSSSGNVIDAVANQTDTDPRELPSLYHTIDPDALNSVGKSLANGKISFTYAGLRVTVDSDETVNVSGESKDGSERPETATDD